MKATRVGQSGHSIFKVPDCFRGGTCPHCGKELRDYAGVRIGNHVYCSFDHYVRTKEAPNA